VFCRHLFIAKKDVQDLLKASGVTADDKDLTVMINKLEGKSLPDLIKEGSKDLAAMPAGGSGGAAAADAGAAAGDAPAKEDKKKEEEPEEDVDMGDLFGGGDDDY
jgi:ribosomal protein L12E/L44/L45/RPP1/RPP2